MKILLACLLFFVLTNECVGQNDISGAQSYVWSRWISQYQRGSSEAPTMIVSEAGEVFLTGRDTFLDYVTIKYGADGRPQWFATYDGPDSYVDKANAITIDSHGNVYVTGESGSPVGCDYATVKYDPNGVEVWATRTDGVGTLDDWAQSVVVDDGGNVYVTGWSESEVGNDDYLTVKYNPLGAEVWRKRFNGTFNSTDHAHKVLVDKSGNVYVGGWSIMESVNFVIVKYDSDGKELWITNFNLDPSGAQQDHLSDMELGSDGCIYATGWSTRSSQNNETDCTTIKVNSSGNVEWARAYDGGILQGDDGIALALDSNNNVFVTGCSEGLNTGLDLMILMYDQEGMQQWVTRYNFEGRNGDDEGYDIAVDERGNPYVTGRSNRGASTQLDYLTLACDQNGLIRWVITYDGGDELDDWGTAIGLDRAGHAYVAGRTSSGFATIRYDHIDPYVRSLPESDNGFTSSRTTSYPNPFNPRTMIRYSVQIEGYVTLKVFDATGKEVATLVDALKPEGSYDVIFDGSNLASGIYFYRFRAGGIAETKKLLLVK